MIKLNLGCGLNKLNGYINIDKEEKIDPDIVRDIERGLPFNDNIIDKVLCSHILEHIKELFFVMNEIWRILKPDGILVIKVPPYDFEGAFSDPTHIRVFTPRTFKFFTKTRFTWVWGFPREIKCLFEIIKFKRQFNKQDDTAVEYYVKMKAIKGEENKVI